MDFLVLYVLLWLDSFFGLYVLSEKLRAMIPSECVTLSCIYSAVLGIGRSSWSHL